MFTVEFDKDSCFICLSNEGVKEHINEHNLKGKYLELTSVEMLLAKGMPSYICEFCKSKLIIAVHFKKQCLMSYKLLQKHFEEVVQLEKVTRNLREHEVELLNEPDNIKVSSSEVIPEDKVPTAEKSINFSGLEYEAETPGEPPPPKAAKKRKLVPKKRRMAQPKQKKILPIENEKKRKKEEEKSTAVVREPKSQIEVEEMAEGKIIELQSYKLQIETVHENEGSEKDNEKDEYACISIIELKDLKSMNRNSDGKKIKVFDGKRVSYMSLCPICNKMQFNIKQHMSVHTGEKKHKCPYCDKSFAQKGNLNHHVNIHTGNKPYQCKVCEKSFAEPNSLRSHMILHTQDKKYHCEVCGKRFLYPHGLTVHRRTHTNERPYSCGICNKSFVVRHTLTKHIRSHTGEKPYECQECGKAFTCSGNLTAHKIVHTKERRFDCHICHLKFGYRSVLKTHMKIHNKFDATSLELKPAHELNFDSQSY